MRVLLINPWAVVNDAYYASGFVSGMSRLVELDFVCNAQYNGEQPSGTLYPFFFKRSQSMHRGPVRTATRGLEYIQTWRRIIGLCKKKHYDVIHIHWLLNYPVDAVFLKYLNEHRHYFGKLVLTAHNVLPHVNGEKQIDILRKIYRYFDEILVHGEAIRQEFIQYFPAEIYKKVSIQYHGEYFKQNTDFCELNSEEYQTIRNRIQAADRTYIMFGAHFYNKGTDRLIHVWNQALGNTNNLLLIMGRVDASYSQLKAMMNEKEFSPNILFIGKFIEDNLLNFAIANSDCVVIPYRHASMSGIVYTASSFQKPVICTRCGAIAEYLMDGEDSFLCDNNDQALREALLRAEAVSREELVRMGQMLDHNIRTKYSWNNITKDLYHQIYCKE